VWGVHGTQIVPANFLSVTLRFDAFIEKGQV